MKKRMSIMVIALVVVFGGLIGFNIFKQYMTAKYMASFKMPPVSVSTTLVKKTDWQPTIDGVGNFSAVNGVDVNSQQSGHVTRIDFSSGDYVEEGKLLLEIDHSIDDASLAEAKANLSLAKISFDRQSSLYKKQAASESEVDQARANYQKSQAEVEKIQATIDQKLIRSPFAGKLGVRLVNLGQFISPGTTQIVTLQSQDPLFLQFYLPEQYLKELHTGQKIVFNVDAYSNFYFQGEIQALNSKVDTNTHNVLVQAQVANCPHPTKSKNNDKLWEKKVDPISGITLYQCDTKRNTDNKIKDFAFVPGMFANIHVMLPIQKDIIVLPRTAINYSLYGNSVYVVQSNKDSSSEKKVFQKFIKTGDERGTKVVVLSGLKPGDEVVNSGQLKLQNGTDVTINNDLKLEEAKDIDALGQ